MASITRVASGTYDLGLGDISSLIEFHAQHDGPAPVQAVYQYYNRAPFVIIGRKDRGISNDFASLKGKKVAAAAVEATRRCWPMVARKLGLDTNLFAWSTTDFSARDNVMVRGDVDAATYFHDSAVSLFARMPQSELSVLKYEQTGLKLYGNAILASRQLIEQRPQVVRAFLAASQQALLETLSNPQAALAAVQAREPMLQAEVERQRWAISQQYLSNAETQSHGLGQIRSDVLNQQIQDVKTVFGLPRAPAAEQVFNTSLMPTLYRA